MDKAEFIKRFSKQLNCSTEEAAAVFEYDKAVDRGEKTPHDLPPEKQKIAQSYARTGTRKTPTVYQFQKKERKPNATKGGIISELFAFLSENSGFSVENLQILNKERQISFEIGGEKFELTLVQKRKPK